MVDKNSQSSLRSEFADPVPGMFIPNGLVSKQQANEIHTAGKVLVPDVVTREMAITAAYIAAYVIEEAMNRVDDEKLADDLDSIRLMLSNMLGILPEKVLRDNLQPIEECN